MGVVLVGLLIFVLRSNSLPCYEYPHVSYSITYAQTNQNWGGEAINYINCSTQGLPSFLSWQQMLGGRGRAPRFSTCECQCQGLSHTTVCIYGFNELGYSVREEGKCEEEIYKYAIFVFDKKMNGPLILLRAYPSQDKIVKEKGKVYDRTSVSSISSREDSTEQRNIDQSTYIEPSSNQL